MALDYSKIGAQAATEEDLNVDQTFERELPVAGVALIRFREYIELGRHESKNPQHKPALGAILVFELSHKHHLIEIEGKMVPQTLQIRINKGITAKSGFRKLFNVMNDALGGGHKNFLTMLGEAFLGEVFHKLGKGEKPQTYANLDKDGAYSFKAPLQVDALEGTSKPIQVRELDKPIKAFVWENKAIADEDVIEMWNDLFIEGTRDVTDKVTKEVTQKSKNWIQELIMANIEWEGSVTQALTQEHVSLDDDLAGGEVALEDLSGAASADAGDEMPEGL